MSSHDTNANGAEGPCLWSSLLPELAERIARCLHPNDVACGLRLINKASAAQFSGPQYTTIRLSQPVPHHAFAAHWLAPCATRGLTLERRQQLLYLTAASGVVANLDVALQAAGCLATYEVFHAAAATGQLRCCHWLLEHGCPTEESDVGSGLLGAAAGGGHRLVCEWLLGLGLRWASDGAVDAARGGHVGLMEWLRQRRSPLPRSGADDQSDGSEQALDKLDVVSGAAEGFDLPTLQRVVQQNGGLGSHDAGTRQDAGAVDEDEAAEAEAEGRSLVLAAAAGSPTPDWAAKVEWLEAQGCPRSARAAERAAARPDDADAAARLAWLRDRGYPLGATAVEAAAGAGNTAALHLLLGEAGVAEPPEGGHLAAF
ncbi:hypothetical protein GPECTOR_1g43 [Gonium pectorale]|uniref:Uncharacterized protein n=1 Tax=Gonium pectorale TaxID=33097 RepID=A0A150H4H8_GONPE|nr:hypothetical protein GPECTOR_1g43 [Gonium pectorale]|eukprot:KXZ56480.1 hypothetical protein GPECTOR_1g43 [Gonium pectorale]